MAEKVLCELGSLCPICNKEEKVLGFKDDGVLMEKLGIYFINAERVPVVSLEWLEKELTKWDEVVTRDKKTSLSTKCLVGRIVNDVISKAKKEAKS